MVVERFGVRRAWGTRKGPQARSLGVRRGHGWDRRVRSWDAFSGASGEARGELEARAHESQPSQFRRLAQERDEGVQRVRERS